MRVYNPGGELSLQSSTLAQAYMPAVPATIAYSGTAAAAISSMLPWLLGAGVIGYLLFFRKKS